MSDEESAIRGRYSEEINRLRDEIERLRLNAQCHPAACRDEMLWRAEIEQLRAANERLRAATLVLLDSLTSGRDDAAEIALAMTEARCRALAGEQEKMG